MVDLSDPMRDSARMEEEDLLERAYGGGVIVDTLPYVDTAGSNMQMLFWVTEKEFFPDPLHSCSYIYNDVFLHHVRIIIVPRPTEPIKPGNIVFIGGIQRYGPLYDSVRALSGVNARAWWFIQPRPSFVTLQGQLRTSKLYASIV